MHVCVYLVFKKKGFYFTLTLLASILITVFFPSLQGNNAVGSIRRLVLFSWSAAMVWVEATEGTKVLYVLGSLLVFLWIFAKMTMGRCKDNVLLVGKTALVTGGNSGKLTRINCKFVKSQHSFW